MTAVAVATPSPQSDFDLDLERIDREIAELESDAGRTVRDIDASTRLAGRRYHRAALTGRPVDADSAEAAVNAALAHFEGAPDLLLIQANIDFMLHRLDGVHRALERSRVLRESAPGRALAADLCFQEGRYSEARRLYDEVMAEDPGWDCLARLAHFEFKLGDPAQAERFYEQAEDELTAKQMRSYAWLQIQCGLLDRAQGRYSEAMAHYRVAQRAYSGYWLVDDHIAEALGAQGDLAASAALYEDIVERVPRPELYQALAEVYGGLGDTRRSAMWEERALHGYLESVRAGGVHYLHHLVDFYADVRDDGAAAVDWACKDIALRCNFSTQAALAWALYRAGRVEDAATAIRDALSSGLRDAHVFGHAALIFTAVGATDEGRRYADMAETLNPHHGGFHVHR